VRVEEARQHGLVEKVDRAGVGRNLHVASDRRDPAGPHEDDLVRGGLAGLGVDESAGANGGDLSGVGRRGSLRGHPFGGKRKHAREKQEERPVTRTVRAHGAVSLPAVREDGAGGSGRAAARVRGDARGRPGPESRVERGVWRERELTGRMSDAAAATAIWDRRDAGYDGRE
jgi:hypothetical protein